MLYPLSYEGGAGAKRGRKPRPDVEPDVREASYVAASSVPNVFVGQSWANATYK